MTITHRGFEFRCDSYHQPLDANGKFIANARTERTAIEHARVAGWFVGRIKIMSGGEASRSIVMCMYCKWLVGT